MLQLDNNDVPIAAIPHYCCYNIELTREKELPRIKSELLPMVKQPFVQAIPLQEHF